MDAESHARAMDKLRRRRAGMQKLLATLRDPQATYREEDGLRQLEGELKALERSQQAHARELTLLSKSVDATRVQLEAERKGGASLAALVGMVAAARSALRSGRRSARRKRRSTCAV